MRKIESQMTSAISRSVNWKSGNTRVVSSDIRNVSEVYLHNNLIAIVANNGNEIQTQIMDGGWQTTTTKSRLNAILSDFNPGTRVYSKNFHWFVKTNDGVEEFNSGMIVK